MKRKILSLLKGVAEGAADLRSGEELSFCWTEEGFGEQSCSVRVSTTTHSTGAEAVCGGAGVAGDEERQDIGRAPRLQGAEMLRAILEEVRRDG